jgi:replicative DNA helicase
MASTDDILRRVPPHNLEAEQSVLDAVFIAPRDGDDVIDVQWRVLADITAVMDADDLYRESHREIFRVMLDLAQRKQPIDAVTLGDGLRTRGKLEAVGGPVYICELAECVPAAASVGYYARIVREKSVLRAIASTATEIAAAAYDSPLHVRDFVAEAESRLSAIARQPMGESEIPLRDAIRNVIEGTERGELIGVPSGFAMLDKHLTDGGFGRSTLNIIGATTSVGKTALITNIAVRVSRGGVLFLSIEMKREEIIRRMLADLGLVDFADMSGRRPAKPNQREREGMAHAENRLNGMSIEILHLRTLTPADVRREARLALSKFDGKLDLIIIDCLQLMNSNEPQKNRNLELAAITKDLKTIASEFDVLVLLPSQLNREGVKAESSEPQLWHLRDSGSIEQDSDVVIFLWETSASHFTSDTKISWKIDKQRNGPKVQLPDIQFEREYTRFRE